MSIRSLLFCITLSIIISGTAQSQVPYDPVEPIQYYIASNSDDGIEVNNADWYESGFTRQVGGLTLYLNYSGKHASGVVCDTGHRFLNLTQLTESDNIRYARLKFSSFGSNISSSVKLLIQGVTDLSPETFNALNRKPSQLPKTTASIAWEITSSDAWEDGLFKDYNDDWRVDVPLYYYSPNISSIINEIIHQTGWDTSTKALIITLDDNGSPQGEPNWIRFDDYNSSLYFRDPVSLEIYKTVYETFLGREILGRVTANSVTVSLYSLLSTDVYVEYGTSSGNYQNSTLGYLMQSVETPIEIVLGNGDNPNNPPLSADTTYFYRVRCRESGLGGSFEIGPERTFHTQRSGGQSFEFSIMSDEHLQSMHMLPYNSQQETKRNNNKALYKRTLQNVIATEPDFLFSLGDFANTELYVGRDAPTLHEATERYLLQRKYIDSITHSIPFFLVVGNHEGEQGWRYIEPSDDLAVISTQARKKLIPNPTSDNFYTGNLDDIPEFGLREDYFAWEWGDALFVALDPFWYTTVKPHDAPTGSGGSRDGWDWTLGKTQYDWLYQTLSNSNKKWKFVFIHHLVSTTFGNENYHYYGMGGTEIAEFFEWGGDNEDTTGGFGSKRSTWQHDPIHDMLVNQGVTAVFHGHDHFCGFQHDGIHYIECPQPGDSGYTTGHKTLGWYNQGDFYPNSGHIQVEVNGTQSVTVKYIQAFLPGDRNNGNVAHQITIY